MQFLSYCVAYAAIAVFVIAVIMRVVMWLRMPMHVRWELYPVAHEPGARGKYGGSYLENGEWWTQPRETSMIGELRVMVPEILFLVAVRENNPKLWLRSFPFHFGIYLVIFCTILMIVAGLLGAVVPGSMEGALGSVFQFGIMATGFGGLCLGILGALGLLERRFGTKELRMYASKADFFNLLFFVAAFGVALITAIAVDRDFAMVTGFMGGLATFQPEGFAGTGTAAILPTLSVILLGCLVAYIPMTHMSHFVGKYFAYHAIRWNDKPTLRGDPEESKIVSQLGKPISWSAPHIKGDGKKSWADVATHNPASEESEK